MSSAGALKEERELTSENIIKPFFKITFLPIVGLLLSYRFKFPILKIVFYELCLD